MTGDGNFLQRLVDLLNSAGITMWHDLDMQYLKKWAVELNIEDLLQRLFEDAKPPHS